jgi:hypothetical protein
MTQTSAGAPQIVRRNLLNADCLREIPNDVPDHFFCYSIPQTLWLLLSTGTDFPRRLCPIVDSFLHPTGNGQRPNMSALARRRWPSGLPAADDLPASSDRRRPYPKSTPRIARSRFPESLDRWRLHQGSPLSCGEPLTQPYAELLYATHPFDSGLKFRAQRPASEASKANLLTAAKR